MNLKGKTAIVTGAARGLGQTYAKAMAAEGMNVLVADRDDVGETLAALGAGAKAAGTRVDVADFASVGAMTRLALDKFGRVDVLVNNAALYGGLQGGRAEAIDDAEWDACMTVNVKGVWNCCRAAIPHMRAQKGGAIVNIASLAAVMGMPYALHYSTSKGAVIALTRALARELGRDGIRVNAVAPTAVPTEGTKQFFGDKLDRQMKIVAGGQSLAGLLEPEDVVGAVLFLASDASRFVTGQTVMVDGGTVFL
ncbi:MAG: SDR family NAD(P)-dependent oxidoreductase [Alphaproteobacteria bacterium]